MSPDKGQGTIPLDDMRGRTSYSGHAVLRKDRNPQKSSDMDRDDIRNNVDGSTSAETDLIQFSSEELSLSESRTNQTTQPPAPDSAQPDDVFESFRVPGSFLHSPAQSFPASIQRESLPPRRRLSDSAEQRDDVRACRRLQELYDTIKKLSEEKQEAQMEAARVADKVDEMKRILNADMDEIARSAEGLGQEVKRLKEENRLLRDELNDAQSHIFSLQPYRKDLTAEEVGRQYDELVEQVQDWVQKFMEPWLDDDASGVESLTNNTRKQTATEAARFRRALQKHPDLVHGSFFPETDEDIVAAIIMRFLHDNIFQKVLYGVAQAYTEMISFIETQMQTAVEPKRDLFAVRTWTAESYNALLSAPQFRSARQRRSKDLTVELAGTLQIFCPKDRYQWFCQNMEDSCVAPAMALYEKLQVSTHHFYLDINPYIVWGPNCRITLSAEFVDAVEDLDCKNMLQNRRAFSVAKLDPRPTRAELSQKLMNVCTVAPALYMRQIGQRDAIKAPVIVRRQQMLVAWGSEEKRAKAVDEGGQSLISHLYLAKDRKRGEGFNWLS